VTITRYFDDYQPVVGASVIPTTFVDSFVTLLAAVSMLGAWVFVADVTGIKLK
jgi:hypothetical protein